MSGSNIKSQQGRTSLPAEIPSFKSKPSEPQKATGGSKTSSPQSKTGNGPVSRSL